MVESSSVEKPPQGDHWSLTLEQTVRAKSIYHDAVVRALKAEGWSITDDPLILIYARIQRYVGLGAEKAPLAPELSGRKIAVEILRSQRPSSVRDFHDEVGKYGMERAALAKIDCERQLYLAVPSHLYEGMFGDDLGQLIITQLELRLFLFDVQSSRIVERVEPTRLTRSPVVKKGDLSLKS